MAELVLGAVGVAIAGIPGIGVTALAGFQIGVALGSILFPPSGPKFDRGRVDEIKIQGAQQGTPIAFIYGRNRTAGTIIWATGLTRTEKTETTGGKGGGVKSTNNLYSTSLAVLVCEGPVQKIRRIWANDKVIYDWRTGGSPVVSDWIDVDKIRVYDGSQTTPDSAIEADKGAGYVPAFKGMCYVVFETLPLAELGDNIPNFTFEVETDWNDLEEVMLDLAERAGLDPSDCNFSALAGMPTRGFLVAARTEAARCMDALAKANWFEIVESGGLIKAVIRTGSSVLTIPADDIGASADNTPKNYVETTRAQEVELPRSLQVSYSSEAQDFQVFTQEARRSVRYSQNQESVSFPMSLSEEYARYLADSLLMEAWAVRSSHVFTLPYRYLKLDPGDVVTIPVEGAGNRAVRILEMNAGLMSEIEVKAVDDDPIIYIDPGLPAAIPPPSNAGVVNNATPDFIAGETNSPYDTFDDFSNQAKIYSAAGRNSSWDGGELEMDPPLSSSLFGGFDETAGTFTKNSTFGFTTADAFGILGDSSLVLGLLDAVNTVRVTLTAGTLASCTFDEMVNEGKNLCAIGKELLQFQNATLVSGTTYTLSNLIRYQRGTDYLLTEAALAFNVVHATSDPFVLIDANVKTFKYTLSSIGQTESFRLLDNGRDYSGGLPSFTDPIVLDGTSRKPYGPVHVHYSGDRSGGPADVDLTWVRRVRTGGDLLSGGDAPLDEFTEEYEVDIWFDDLSGVARTISVAGTPAATYTAADQTTDGFDASPFYVIIYQLSTMSGVGRGHPSALKYVDLTPDIYP